MHLGMWEISGDLPSKIPEARLGLEKEFEDWIEADPSFLHHGLTIVGRQVRIEGGIIDLLALDPYGSWVVIEIKAGQLDRDVIAQVVDYASCISELSSEELSEITNTYLSSKGNDNDVHSLLVERDAADALDPDERDVKLIVAGTGRTTGLNRMARFLNESDEIQLAVVTFSVFQSEGQPPLLVREMNEPEVEKRTAKDRGSMATVEEIFKKADSNGIGPRFRQIYEVATSAGLFARPYKRSIMYTPMDKKNVMVFTVQAESRSGLTKLYTGPNYFNSYFPISEEEASNAIGISNEGWYDFDEDGVADFIAGLKKIFEIIEDQ